VRANHSTPAQIRGNVGLLASRYIDLKKSFVAENAGDNSRRPIDEPTKKRRRAVDLAAPFRGPGWSKENQMLETQSDSASP